MELTFATNVLGPHLLTRLLRERLIASAGGRVLFVSSGGMYTRRLDVDDLQRVSGHVRRARSAYARTKRAEVVLAERWAAAPRGHGGSSCMRCTWGGPTRPASRAPSPASSASCGPLLRTPEQGADTIVWLAAADEPAQITGRFWCDRHVRATHRLAPHAGKPPKIAIGSGTVLDALAAGRLLRGYDHALRGNRL